MGWDVQARNTSIPTKHSDVQAIKYTELAQRGSFYKVTLVPLLHVLLFNIPFFFFFILETKAFVTHSTTGK